MCFLWVVVYFRSEREICGVRVYSVWVQTPIFRALLKLYYTQYNSRQEARKHRVTGGVKLYPFHLSICLSPPAVVARAARNCGVCVVV